MVHGVNNPLVYYEKPHQAIGEMNQTFEGGLFPNYQSIMDERTHHLSHAPVFIHPPTHPIIHPFPASFLSRMFKNLRFRLCLRDPFLPMSKPRQMYQWGTFYDCLRPKRLTLTLLTAFLAAPVPHGCFASQLASRANWKNRVPNRFSRKHRIPSVFSQIFQHF